MLYAVVLLWFSIHHSQEISLCSVIVAANGWRHTYVGIHACHLLAELCILLPVITNVVVECGVLCDYVLDLRGILQGCQCQVVMSFIHRVHRDVVRQLRVWAE